MKKILTMMLFLLGVLSYMMVYGVTVANELSDNVLRFHILANSNTEVDQKIKLEVRDYVSRGISDVDISPHSEEYRKKAEALANEYLRVNDVPYSATATRERVYISKKRYKNITMPSGEYDAIRLSLGEGNGDNWWCVAYPALCFSESFDGELSDLAKSKLSESISKESYSVITDEREYRLFIVDFIGKLMSKL